MINANITNHNTTHIGNFTVNITFAKPVTGFKAADITWTAKSGNGITNLSFGKVIGTGANYMVAVSVPASVVGAFDVHITGNVNVDSTSHKVVATKQTFTYDTVFDVQTAFGAPNYRSHAEIALPITFGEDVLWFNKTDLTISKVTGSEAFCMDYYIVGEGKSYEAVFLPAPNTAGAISVDITGEVVTEANLVREIVNVDPILIPYNTLTPTIEDISAPFKTSDGWWNIAITYAYPVIGVHVHTFILGTDAPSRVLYQARTLDTEPTDPPPPYSKDYDMARIQQHHIIGDWQCLGTRPSKYQARHFYLKLQSAEPPEISLKQTQAVLAKLLPVSVG